MKSKKWRLNSSSGVTSNIKHILLDIYYNIYINKDNVDYAYDHFYRYRQISINVKFIRVFSLHVTLTNVIRVFLISYHVRVLALYVTFTSFTRFLSFYVTLTIFTRVFLLHVTLKNFTGVFLFHVTLTNVTRAFSIHV